MRRALGVAAALGLAGCALDVGGTEWTKPGVMFQEVTAVEIQCARRAFEIVAGPDLVVGGVVDVVRFASLESSQAGDFEDCMTRQGYSRTR